MNLSSGLAICAEGPRQEDVHILQAGHSGIGRHGSAVETLVKFIGYGDGLLMALHVRQLRLMDRNPFHLAHLDTSGASRPGMDVPDEFHEASRFANHSTTPKSPRRNRPAGGRTPSAAGWSQLVVSGNQNGNRQ